MLLPAHTVGLSGLILSDQDGGTVGHEAHLLPQIHQNYIYMWRDSHRTSTECWQETSDFGKGIDTYLGEHRYRNIMF